MESESLRRPASGRQIAKGAAWLMLFKIADRGIGLVSTLVLARLLTPADFGLVAMAMAVIALTELMGAFGFDSALIQRQNARREHYDTAWTFNVCFGIAISALIVILAIPAAGFYHESRLQLILPVLAIGAFVGGFENIGTVAFRKELNFRSEFRFLLAKRLASFIVTITLAVSFRTYWALVAGVVTGKLTGVLISYWLHPYRPRITLAARRDLLHFSKWIFISNLIQFLHMYSAHFIVGRTIGPHGLGIYNVASEIAAMPSTELIAPLNRAVYPAYARLSGVLEELRSRFIEVFSIISLIAFPVAVGMFCVADPAVRILLGPQWLEAIPVIQIFAISGLAGALQSNLYLVIVALGRPKANTILSAALLSISLPVIVVASLYYGVLGAAYAHFGTALLGLFGIVFVFSRLTGIKPRTLGAALWRPALSSVIMAATVFSAIVLINSKSAYLLVIIKLGILIIVGAVSYVASVLGLWVLSGRPTGAEKILFTALVRKLRAWRLARLA